jgi:hypothetical protein
MKVAVYQELHDNGLFFRKDGYANNVQGIYLGEVELPEVKESGASLDREHFDFLEENTKRFYDKPPLDIATLKKHRESRIAEIDVEIQKLKDLGKAVPNELFSERFDLSTWLAMEKALRENIFKDLLITKEAEFYGSTPNYEDAYMLRIYQFPICALDIKPPTYKIKE